MKMLKGDVKIFMKTYPFIFKSYKGVKEMHNMDRRSHCLSSSLRSTFKMKVLKYFQDILETSPQKTEEKSTHVSSLLSSLESPEVIMKEPKKFDIRYSQALPKMSSHEVFKILNTLTKIATITVIDLYFYKNSIEFLKVKMLQEKLNKHEILQLLYYAGFRKKLGKRHVKLCMNLLKNEDFSLFELCIIAETAFKCTAPLTQELQQSIVNTVQKEYDYLCTNAHLLVIVCKAFRHNKINHLEIIKEIGARVVNSSMKFSLTRGVHILKLYAQMFYDDTKILDRLVRDIMTDISSHNLKSTIRLHPERACKYLSGFLLCIAVLNYELSDQQLWEVLKFKETLTDHLLHRQSTLINIFFWLKMIGVKVDQEIYTCFRDNHFNDVIKDRKKSSLQSKRRLQLLLEAVKIESSSMSIAIPQVYKRNLIKKVMEPHRALFILLTNLEELSEELQLSNIRVDFPIYGLHLIGVSCVHPHLGNIYIDILDESTCLKVSNTPYGLLKFKHRLLKQIRYTPILVRENDVINKEILSKQMKNVQNN